MSIIVETRANASGAWATREALLDTLNITDAINEPSTLNVTLLDRLGTTHFHKGSGVRVARSGEATVTADDTTTTVDALQPTADSTNEPFILFNGYIDTSSEGRLGIGGSRRHDLSCVDQHYLAMKRVIARAYQNQTAGAIVRDLIGDPDDENGHLYAEGVTEGIIEDGPTVREVTFNYVTFAQAIADLAERAGFWWRISPELRLDFANPLALLAVLAGSEGINAGAEDVLAGAEAGDGTPLDLTTVALADTISVQRHAHTYRNRQWVRGGRDRTTPQTEVQAGDGEQRAFVLGFPVASTPTIEVSRNSGSFVAESVGIGGIDTDTQWLWNEGSNSVSQATSGTVLAAADRVRVVYTGFFDVIVRVDDEPKRLARAGVEGGTGLIENVLVDSSSDSQSASLQLAGELLSYYGRDAVVIRFATESRAFQPGQRRAVALAEADVTAFDALVTTVEWFTISARLRCVVTLVAGPLEGSWAQWLGALSRRIDRANDKRGREVEIITTLEQFDKDWTEAERPNIFVEFFPGAALFPGATPVPSFLPNDRVLFLEWWNGGASLGRKENTTQSGALSTEIVTSTVLVSTDAVGDITELVWYGGMRATAAPGTGVEVAREAFVKTKTDIEQIVVERTDRRWA